MTKKEIMLSEGGVVFFRVQFQYVFRAARSLQTV